MDEKKTGSVYQRKDGYWIGAVSLPDASGALTRQTVGAKTEHNARAKLDALIGGTRLPTTATQLREVRHAAWTEGNNSPPGESPYQ